MFTLTDSDYKNLAQIVRGAIDNTDFFNGTLSFEPEGHTAELRTTLVIYREPLLDPADPTHTATRIRDIVPVWWEFHSYAEGSEVANDFSWREFRDYLV